MSTIFSSCALRSAWLRAVLAWSRKTLRVNILYAALVVLLAFQIGTLIQTTLDK